MEFLEDSFLKEPFSGACFFSLELLHVPMSSSLGSGGAPKAFSGHTLSSAGNAPLENKTKFVFQWARFSFQMQLHIKSWLPGVLFFPGVFSKR